MDRITKLIEWLEGYDVKLLKNEDDVETKLVIPLLQHFGYSDEYRRGKYPLREYRPSGRGRRPEIDQAYFSESNLEKQNITSSLLIVEAKEPNEISLDRAVEQAQFYANHLKPPFLIVTNGYSLKVFKRSRHGSDEVLFDSTIDDLKILSKARNLYEQINFSIAKHVKEHLTDDLTHMQYVQLTNALQQYPHLQSILNQGDFTSSITREGNRLIVVKPKVAITCDLPVAFDEGSCQIEFSSVMLRGLTIQLPHKTVLGSLMLGLHSSPHANARQFLRKTKGGNFEAVLGQTTTILSEIEAAELCFCIDIVCQEYKDRIVQAENILQTWNYRILEVENIRGFHLITVHKWLWDLMKQFSREFDYDEGKSEWHIFDRAGLSIRISYRIGDHAWLWPKTEDTFRPSDHIHILYQDFERDFKFFGRWSKRSWKDEVGPRGFWTANYTRIWLLEKFIPKVLSYYKIHIPDSTSQISILRRWILENFFQDIYMNYKRQNQIYEKQLERMVIDEYSDEYIPFSEITEINQLSSYVGDVQLWLLEYQAHRISTELLRPYYQIFAKLAKKANPSDIDTNYIRSKLSVIGYKNKPDREIESLEEKYTTFEDILEALDAHAMRISNVGYEDPDDADLLSRVFLTIIEQSQINLWQDEINMAIKAIEPLWQQSRFETRYVFPNST